MAARRVVAERRADGVLPILDSPRDCAAVGAHGRDLFVVLARAAAAVPHALPRRRRWRRNGRGWEWGGGWLDVLGFSDFAGSTLVHACGGSAALAGVMLLGPRLGRFSKTGESTNMEPFAPSSIPLVALGTFILWMGWFGFNGGSQLALGSFEDATAMSTIFMKTHLAACGGCIAGAAISRLVGGKTDVVIMLNGALAGLVSITA